MLRRIATAILCGALALSGADRVANAQPALSCAKFTSEPLPPPAPRAVAWPVKRFAAIREQVRTAPHRVLFLGNSLVERFPHDAPEVWREHMQPRGVLNAGVSGDRTENLLWRLRNGNLDGPPPALVILLIGTNDLTHDGPPRSPELTAAGIRANLLYLRQRLPDTPILLLGLLPRGASPDSELRRKVVAVNRLISRCADRRSVFYADIGGALLDAQGQLTPEVSPDRLHFSATGYARLAPLLAAMIDNLAGQS
ncbi:MAG: GDSL-type esterase/lipase family protein [Alphaproteobacteria bacterium]